MKSVIKSSKIFFNLWLHELEGIVIPTIYSVLLLIIINTGNIVIKFIYLNKMYVENFTFFDKLSFNLISEQDFFSNIFESFFVILPIIVLLIVFMSMYIWIKEWFVKKRSIYRLLILPVSKFMVIFSKFLAIISYLIILIGSLIISTGVQIIFIGNMADKTFSLNNILTIFFKNYGEFNLTLFFTISLIFFFIISFSFLISIISKVNLKALTIGLITIIAIITMSFWGKYYIGFYFFRYLEYQLIITISLISLIFTGIFICLSKFLLDNKMNF